MTEMAKNKDLEGIFKLGTQMFAENYQKAVNSVLSNPAPDSPLYPYACQFQHNTANLAAWKAYRLANELTSLTNDEDIKLAIKKYNQWQAVEYNAITARTRTARQLLDFKKRANIYPNLKWVRSRSANPREGHLALVGLVLPYNDPFWASNQPGSLYGCKCDWIQTDEPASGQIPEAVIPSPGLEGNPLVTGQLITRSAGHFRSQENRVVKNSIFEILEDSQWVEFDKIKAHILQKPHEVKNNVSVASAYLNSNKDAKNIVLLPECFEDQLKYRDKMVPQNQRIGKGKQPDAVINFNNGHSVVAEFKHLEGNGKHLFNHVKDAGNTCDYAVVLLSEHSVISDNEIRGAVISAMEKGLAEKVTVIKSNGEIITENKP